MESKPPIQRMTEKLMEAKGMDYARITVQLRYHLEWLTDERFEAEIGRVTNPRIFGKLYSMGLNYRRQQACVVRATELEGMVKE